MNGFVLDPAVLDAVATDGVKGDFGGSAGRLGWGREGGKFASRDTVSKSLEVR